MAGEQFTTQLIDDVRYVLNELDKKDKALTQAQATIQSLTEENQALREALEFYADGSNNWYRNADRPNFDIIAKDDITTEGIGVRCGGKKAREVLNRYPAGAKYEPFDDGDL